MDVAQILDLLDRWDLVGQALFSELPEEKAAAAAKVPDFGDSTEEGQWFMEKAPELACLAHELLGPASCIRFAEMGAIPTRWQNNLDLWADIAKLRALLRAKLPSAKAERAVQQVAGAARNQDKDVGSWTSLTNLLEWHFYFPNTTALRRFILRHPDKFMTRKPTSQRLDVSDYDWLKWKATKEAKDCMDKNSGNGQKPKRRNQSKKVLGLIPDKTAIESAIASEPTK